MTMDIHAGQIWRHEDGRKVRVLQQQGDGRWVVQTATNASGEPTPRGKKKPVNEATLRTYYEHVPGE